MIKRIFKTIFIFSLVFSTAFNTVAAVSVSDGSAFITKSEFMTDINNLSSRVAQVELTIDGILDGKVNSYLEQKGFWKQKSQTLFEATATNIVPCAATRDASNNTAKGTETLLTKTLIQSTSSPGMCLLNLGYKANNTTTQNARWGYYGAKTGNYYYELNLMLVSEFYEVIDNVETKKATLIIGNNLGQMRQSESSTSAYVNCIMLPTHWILLPAMFFVSKGSEIKWNLKESYGFAEIGATPTRMSSTNGSGIDIQIQDVVIY